MSIRVRGRILVTDRRPRRQPPVAPGQNGTGDANLLFGLGVVTFLGGLVRVLPVAAHPFPLNDGGLFHQMASDIVSAGFALPVETSYNAAGVPFAYPPLGIYTAAIAAQLPGVEILDVMRWLPAVMSILTIPAFYLLARQLAPTRFHALAATTAFALVPRAYQWLVVGGGLTRALGLLLALLVLQQSVRMYRVGRWRNVVGAGVLGGLTLLSHPQAAVFAAVTAAVFLLALGRHRGGLIQTAVAGLIALTVAAPWLITIGVRHGVGWLAAGSGTGTDLGAGASALFSVFVTDIGTLDLFTAMGVLGGLLLLARRQWMAPAWLAAIIVLDPRAGHTYAAVPLAILAIPVIASITALLVPAASAGQLESVPLPTLARMRPAAAAFSGLLLFVALRTNSLATVDKWSPLQGVTGVQQATMSWVADHTPGDAAFAVVTGREWTYDSVSEWFPVLAERRSVATVQGTEWGGSFVEQLAIDRQLQACAIRTAACIESWIQGQGSVDLYVYVSNGDQRGGVAVPDCCPGLRETLRASDEFELQHDGPGGTVFRYVGQ
jgi:hypothetical protein